MRGLRLAPTCSSRGPFYFARRVESCACKKQAKKKTAKQLFCSFVCHAIIRAISHGDIFLISREVFSPSWWGLFDAIGDRIWEEKT